MPAPRKSSTQPRSNGTAPRLASVPAVPDGLQPPDLPDGMLDETRQAWVALWEEPQAAHLTGAQRVVALRWAEAFDAWRRALEVVKAMPVVDGSQGQPVQNPLMSWVTSREAEMEKCERQLGIGLRNKADLGLTVGQVKLTAAQLNEMTRRGSSGSSNEAAAVERPEELVEGWSAVE